MKERAKYNLTSHRCKHHTAIDPDMKALRRIGAEEPYQKVDACWYCTYSPILEKYLINSIALALVHTNHLKTRDGYRNIIISYGCVHTQNEYGYWHMPYAIIYLERVGWHFNLPEILHGVGFLCV